MIYPQRRVLKIPVASLMLLLLTVSAALLIERGSDVNVRGRARETPMHIANRKEMAELLVNSGAAGR
jgi:hypothetical protein